MSHRIDQARRAARRRQLRLHRLILLLQQMGARPPGLSPSAGPGGTPASANADITALAAQLTALGFPPRAMYSVRFLQSGQATTNALVGAITRWDDARGAVGFGPSLPAVATPHLIGSGPSTYFVTTDGSASGLLSAPVAAFDLSTALTLITVRTLTNVGAAYPNTFNPYVGIAGAANVPYLGVLPTNTLSTSNLESTFLEPGAAQTLVSPPTVITYDGRTLLEVLTVTGATVDVVAPPGPVEAFSLSGTPSAGSNALGVGTDGSGTLFGASQHRAILVLPGVASAAAILACVQWATAHELALNDAPKFLFFDGDSLTFGFSLPDQSQCYPVQVMALSPYASGWAYCQTGTPSIALQAGGSPTLNSRAASLVDAAYNYSETRTENICVIWAGTNDMAIYAASGTTTFGYLQTYVNARRAVGWKVVIVTCIDRGDHDINTERGVYNGFITATYGGGAVPGVAVADAAANSHLGSNTAWMDTTYFLSDMVHLTPVGYGLVAPLVSAAVQSIL